MILHNIGHSVPKTSRIRSRTVKGLISATGGLGLVSEEFSNVSVSAMKVSSASLLSGCSSHKNWGYYMLLIPHGSLFYSSFMRHPVATGYHDPSAGKRGALNKMKRELCKSFL